MDKHDCWRKRRESRDLDPEILVKIMSDIWDRDIAIEKMREFKAMGEKDEEEVASDT